MHNVISHREGRRQSSGNYRVAQRDSRVYISVINKQSLMTVCSLSDTTSIYSQCYTCTTHRSQVSPDQMPNSFSSMTFSNSPLHPPMRDGKRDGRGWQNAGHLKRGNSSRHRHRFALALCAFLKRLERDCQFSRISN
jgi:hypothetical protein